MMKKKYSQAVYCEQGHSVDELRSEIKLLLSDELRKAEAAEPELIV